MLYQYHKLVLLYSIDINFKYHNVVLIASMIINTKNIIILSLYIQY